MNIEMREMPVWRIADPTGERIVKRLKELIVMYGFVSVLDLYDVINMYESSFEFIPSYIENKYGWTNIFGFRLKELKRGYTIVYDTPVPLNDLYAEIYNGF